jgi:hypothetical protein
MKKYLIIILLIGTTQIVAQKRIGKMDWRFGTGISLLGTGDMRTINFENEINYKYNQYFANSISLNCGRSIFGLYESSFFIQGNLNIYISPFGNDNKNDLRFGTGLSYYNISDNYEQIPVYDNNGQLIHADHEFSNRNAIGFNIIVESSHMITERFMMGLKFFVQPYLNGDINTGILLRLGFKLQ